MPTLQFLGHSACLVSHQDTGILIDPFLTGNPVASCGPESLHPTAILLTHAHNDHLGDTVAIAQRTGCSVVAIWELATWCQQQGLTAHPLSIGGAFRFEWGRVKMTPAWHGSTYLTPEGQFVSLGMPAGFLLELGGKTIYHAGDTGLFGDMALLSRGLDGSGIDLALLPIGDNFTMGPEDALEAVRLLRPRHVVPIHYDTFPLIAQDAAAWCSGVRDLGIAATVVPPGGTLSF